MKSTRIVLAVLAGAAACLGCVPDRTSIEFGGVYEPVFSGEDCVWTGGEGGAAMLNGSMNTSIAGGYMLVLKLENNLPADEVKVGNTTTSPSTRNDFVIQEGEFSYECKDTTAKCAGFTPPKPTIVQLAGVLKANSTNDFLMGVMTPEAGEAIAGWATDEPAIILVKMKFRGTYVSGATHETDTIAFPVTVYQGLAPAPCPAGTEPNYPQCGKTRPPNFGMNGLNYYSCETVSTSSNP